MGESDFQNEMFSRLSKLEQGQAAMLSMLGERCAARNEMLRRHEEILQGLVAAEYRQAGERKVFAGILTVLGTIGGLVGSMAVKIMSGGGGQ